LQGQQAAVPENYPAGENYFVHGENFQGTCMPALRRFQDSPARFWKAPLPFLHPEPAPLLPPETKAT